MRIMKTGLKGITMASLLTMGTAAVFTSCSKDNELVNEINSNDLVEIKLAPSIINGSVSAWTREASASTATAVAEGDTLRLCVNDHGASDYSRLYLQKITAGTNGKMAGETAMYFPTSGNNVDLYAYRGVYTITSNKTNESDKVGKEIIKDGTTFSVSVNYDQSTADNYKRSDFIFGQKLDQQRTKDTIKITLGHVLSRIVVKVKGSSDIAGQNMKLTGIKVNDAIINGTYTLGSNANTWSNSASNDSIKDVYIYKSTSGTDITDSQIVEDGAVIIPQAMKDKVLEFTTYGTNGSDGKSFTYKFPDITFVAGKSYNYTVTLSSFGLNVSAEITDWDEVTNTDIVADYDTPTSR